MMKISPYSLNTGLGLESGFKFYNGILRFYLRPRTRLGTSNHGYWNRRPRRMTFLLSERYDGRSSTVTLCHWCCCWLHQLKLPQGLTVDDQFAIVSCIIVYSKCFRITIHHLINIPKLQVNVPHFVQSPSASLVIFAKAFPLSKQKIRISCIQRSYKTNIWFLHDRICKERLNLPRFRVLR